MTHTILFTGHMIDAKDRKVPRFPANKEDDVREAIRKELAQIKEKCSHQLTGIAGGASGGDILFHELCEEMEIPGHIYLALPLEDYKQASVSFAGNEWEARFEKLTSKNPVNVLPENLSNDNIWESTNLWMLEKALEEGGKNMTLIALWDLKTGDGEGGTEHMVKVADNEGAKTIIIDINKL